MGWEKLLGSHSHFDLALCMRAVIELMAVSSAGVEAGSHITLGTSKCLPVSSHTLLSNPFLF
jgi:hypothetical protein